MKHIKLKSVLRTTGTDEAAIREAIELLCGLEKHPASVFGQYTFDRIVKRYKMYRFMKDRLWPFSPLPIEVWEASTAAAWPQMAAAVLIIEAK